MVRGLLVLGLMAALAFLPMASAQGDQEQNGTGSAACVSVGSSPSIDVDPATCTQQVVNTVTAVCDLWPQCMN